MTGAMSRQEGAGVSGDRERFARTDPFLDELEALGYVAIHRSEYDAIPKYNPQTHVLVAVPKVIGENLGDILDHLWARDCGYPEILLHEDVWPELEAHYDERQALRRLGLLP